MPSYTRGQKRDKVTYVEANSKILYGFSTKDFAGLAGAGITAADITALGHYTPTAAGALTGRIPVIGCRTPKPPRVRKALAGGDTATAATQGSANTFCGYNSIGTAQAQGWKLSKAGKLSVNVKPARGTRKTQTAIAVLSNGAWYCFPMNTADFAAYKTALGLKGSADVTTDVERASLIAGSNIPKPGQAKLDLALGSFSSFYSSDAPLTDTDTAFERMSYESVFALVAAPPPTP